MFYCFYNVKLKPKLNETGTRLPYSGSLYCHSLVQQATLRTLPDTRSPPKWYFDKNFGNYIPLYSNKVSNLFGI